MIVVDVGCKSHEKEESIGPLIRRFRPDILFGFDPHPELTESLTCWDWYGDEGNSADEPSVLVLTRRAAAWTHNRGIYFRFDGTRSHPDHQRGETLVESFDLAAFLRLLPPREEVVLKIDAEGSEYVLLPYLIAEGLDERLQCVLVEWHDHHGLVYRPDRAQKNILKTIRCPLENW